MLQICQSQQYRHMSEQSMQHNIWQSCANVNHMCQIKCPHQIEAWVDDGNEQALTAISQYCIKSCFRDMQFCNPEYGIFGAQPGDMLCMFQLGIVKTSIELFYNCLTPSQKYS